MHIWFDGEHLIETGNRRAVTGMYYLMPVGGQMLYRVEEVQERTEAEVEFTASDGAADIMDGPVDNLVVSTCYAVGPEKYYSDERLQGFPREMFERDGSLAGYMDPPPIPFEPADW
jgi:hypothetical protein